MNGIDEAISKLAEVTPESGDYMGEGGLLYCGKCHTAKQFRMEKPPFEGRIFPHLCKCGQERRDKENAEQKEQEHRKEVDRLKDRGFTDRSMREWTFAKDNGSNSLMKHARFYVEHFEDMRRENIGYLLWGGVGTGKSYFAGCIANALMEQETAVCMTNFAAVLNDLAASFEGRNEYIDRLCRFPLLILDDFGMERGTEYGLEQVYNVIDSRYRSGRPLIVTTNLHLEAIRTPTDIAHARIYDRILELCAPIQFSGGSFRRQRAQEKLDRLKAGMK